MQSANDPASEQLADTNATESKLAADQRAIFDALLHDVLTDPDFKDSREFYGTAGDQQFALVCNENSGVLWPEWYIPSVEGFESSRVIEGAPTDDSRPRLLGIRLDKFNVGEEPNDDGYRLLDGQIQITLLNAGGTGGDSIRTGGCNVFYDANYDRGKWIVQCKGSIDP